MKAPSKILVSCSIITLMSWASAMGAGGPAYKVDQSFGQDQFKSPPECLAIDAKDQLHVLLRDGTVAMFDAAGKLTGSFKPAMTPAPKAMAVADGKIYLLSTTTAEKTREFQGKKIVIREAAGVICHVYTPAGAKEGELQLPEAMSATDAHFIGKELAVADYQKSRILVYQISGNEGKVTQRIEKTFRLCCGIFDFYPGPADSLVVANLGAFKVQSFKNGRKSAEFGARGEKEHEFTGCCNPVNVACLADGAIITVEKSPTRVKIFNKTGKSEKVITGLGELVKGCSTIPIAVDSKDTIYLASDSKNCIVKCVAANP